MPPLPGRVLAARLRRTAIGALLDRGTDRSRRTGPRIAVVGNCQARGIGDALHMLAPRARVDVLPAGALARRYGDLDGLADALASYDHVFSQPFGPGLIPGGGTDALAQRLPALRLYPTIVFTGFHPDTVYVGALAAGGRARLVPSPLGTYHSAIVLFGHLRGLRPERIARLFRDDVFAQLGYLDVWDSAVDDLLRAGRAVGFDLSAELLRWARGGLFMHNINHPRLTVLGDVARRLLREAGLDPVQARVDDYLGDGLLDDVVWPVYPPLAALYGFSGSYTFKRRHRPGARPEILGLEALVAESLALYRGIPRTRLSCHRIEHWSARREIGALFDRG